MLFDHTIFDNKAAYNQQDMFEYITILGALLHYPNETIEAWGILFNIAAKVK